MSYDEPHALQRKSVSRGSSELIGRSIGPVQASNCRWRLTLAAKLSIKVKQAHRSVEDTAASNDFTAMWEAHPMEK